MNEEEAIAHLKWLLDDGILAREDEEPVETILQLLEQKDNRIDELEKALIDEDFKYRNKIDKLKNKLKEDKEKMQTYYDDNEMNYYKQIDYILEILEG